MKFVLVIILTLGFGLSTIHAQSPVTLKIFTQSQKTTIPDNFLGLSFGSATLKSFINGTYGYFFASYNSQGIELFNTLGIKSLRIGGGQALWTSDGSLPNRPDIDALFGFVEKVDNLKVIYAFPLFNAVDTSDASAAKYVWNNYHQYIDSFELDNEPDWHSSHTYPGHIVDPDIYETSPGVAGTAFPSYMAKWEKIAAAIVDSVPEAKFAGPSTGSNYPVAGAKNTYYLGKSWTVNFANGVKNSGIIKLITLHNYVGQDVSGLNLTAQKMIDIMLSPTWDNTNYPALYNGTCAALTADSLQYRIEESNSFSGALAGGSNSFATALFALDYLHWWAAHGAAGISFHVKEWISNAVISNLTLGNYGVYPMAYGLKAFDLGGHGTVDSVGSDNPDGLNLTAYAVTDTNGLYITIINKEHGSGARNAKISIEANGYSDSDSVMFLTADSISATTGVTLGGAAISSMRPWQGTWASLDSINAASGSYTITVPASSAAVVKISKSATSVLKFSELPKKFVLEQNYPNPFNPATVINYTIPSSGFVMLKVYNMIGQEVATLYQGMQKAGTYNINFDASKLSSGVYFYRLQSGGLSLTKKMILLK